ncbi:MAG: phytanoyl-CoA dioxygenase family protein [candidate division Zixibacteria bacterium]|nr:phytanoyl-CoA dioxygenase family protein [candidate division Zixibacteria bacterium]
MRLSETQIEKFKERGFLNVGRVYNDEEADRLLERMMQVIAGTSRGKAEAVRNMRGGEDDRDKPVVIQIVNTWQADDMFRAHLYHPQICEMATQLIGTDVLRVWHDQVQYKPPVRGGTTDWHQDHPYWPIIQPADLISAWVALDDATTENGCMRMVARSHLWGPHKGGTIGTNPDDFSPTPDLSLVPTGEKIEIVPCEVKKGECMFHHCLTWHGSPTNPSQKGRPAIAVHYMPGWTRYEPNRTHIMEHRVTVKPGEELKGHFFPTVWDHGPITPPASWSPGS